MKSLPIRIWYSISYWLHPPWDTGIPAPELVKTVADLAPGRALDIGCGTGTNLLYLAQNGWRVTGIDFVPRAIAKARAKLKTYSPTLLVGDVTEWATLGLSGSYDLVLDIGCFHGLPPGGREKYSAGLARWTSKGSLYMLYAWQPAPTRRAGGVSRRDVIDCFEKHFTLAGYEQGMGRPSAWYYFARK